LRRWALRLYHLIAAFWCPTHEKQNEMQVGNFIYLGNK
jgi:hypothetical protein